MIARSSTRCGIDVETRRSRAAAFRRASSWCGTTIDSTEQWTQAEALWKAGCEVGEPRPGSIALPDQWRNGWQRSSDDTAWIYTCGDAEPWSVALLRAGTG
ncbi:hypothetical protein ACPPVW_07410 [Leifsonia sp. McL0607]|uniref:hypothetical protein n=1 Tax=Leifsonia sp. McL0607 TaxID=3415672 RepID=UPI003CEEDFF7